MLNSNNRRPASASKPKPSIKSKPTRKRNKNAQPNQTAVHWVGVRVDAELLLDAFIKEFQYLSASVSDLPRKYDEDHVWIAIDKTIVDLPLLNEEWYSFTKESQQKEKAPLHHR